MVVLKGKAQTQVSSPLSIAPKSESTLQKEALSFSQLLQGFASIGKVVKGEKNPQETQTASVDITTKQETTKTTKVSKKENETQDTLVASTKKSTPKTLADLMQVSTETSSQKLEKNEIALNPQITTKLTPSELKTLVNEAKEYLKAKIMQTDGFKNAEIAALPKTLRGLTQVAQKLGLEPSKITIEEVKRTITLPAKELNVQNLQGQKKEESSTLVSEETALKTKGQTSKTAKVQTQTQQTAQIQTPQDEKVQQVVEKVSEHKAHQSLKETPLFKAQTPTEITTQEIVSAKAVAFEMKKPKEKAEDNLKLLLRAQTSQKSETGLTADFSVASAKLIAPQLVQTQAHTQAVHNLESFLQGKSSEESNTVAKLETTLQAKTESFEVKINEAKQMMKYLSTDIKTAIEDYKSPFTRVKVQLNPQRLGEIDLTVVQRGKNLHVTLSSNNAAINTLAMNVNDLRLQLTNNGIQNATLNFSSNSQGQEGSAQGQQNSQQRREEAHKEYLHRQSEETHEEILSSLEIVVPHYA